MADRPPLLELVAVSKQFAGLKAVDGVSYALASGGIHAVIGPNGAGKSTLFNLVSGVEQPTAGSIRFDGSEISRRPPHRITRAGVARTFQNVRLFNNLTALENIKVGRHCRTRADFLLSIGKPPWVLAEERAISRWARDLLDFVGLGHKDDVPAKALPLAEERRLEIARALATDPRLLLLDEPAAGLAGRDTLALIALLEAIEATGVTILLIEHNMGLVMDVCQDVLVLNFGRVIGRGTPAEVQANSEVVAAYLGAAV